MELILIIVVLVLLFGGGMGRILGSKSRLLVTRVALSEWRYSATCSDRQYILQRLA